MSIFIQIQYIWMWFNETWPYLHWHTWICNIFCENASTTQDFVISFIFLRGCLDIQPSSHFDKSSFWFTVVNLSLLSIKCWIPVKADSLIVEILDCNNPRNMENFSLKLGHTLDISQLHIGWFKIEIQSQCISRRVWKNIRYSA